MSEINLSSALKTTLQISGVQHILRNPRRTWNGWQWTRNNCGWHHNKFEKLIYFRNLIPIIYVFNTLSDTSHKVDFWLIFMIVACSYQKLKLISLKIKILNFIEKYIFKTVMSCYGCHNSCTSMRKAADTNVIQQSISVRHERSKISWLIMEHISGKLSERKSTILGQRINSPVDLWTTGLLSRGPKFPFHIIWKLWLLFGKLRSVWRMSGEAQNPSCLGHYQSS